MATRPNAATLERFAAVLREFDLVAEHGLEEYRSSVYVRRATERLIQLTCDLACELNCLALAARGVDMPAGYAESFRAMAAAGLLPEALVDKLVNLADLRRRILYDSTPMDDEQVHRRLPFLSVLLREYGRAMESLPDGGGP